MHTACIPHETFRPAMLGGCAIASCCYCCACCHVLSLLSFLLLLLPSSTPLLLSFCSPCACLPDACFARHPGISLGYCINRPFQQRGIALTFFCKPLQGQLLFTSLCTLVSLGRKIFQRPSPCLYCHSYNRAWIVTL